MMDLRNAKKLPLIWAVWLLLASLGWASDILSVDGYYKSFFVVYDRTTSFTSDTPPLVSVANRLRLNSFWRICDRIRATVSYDLAPRVQDRRLFVQPPIAVSIDAMSYRFADLDSRLYPSVGDDIESFAVFQNLDRAFITVRTDWADLFVGRQAIAFGSARVINPIDVIAPYSYETLDVEDRIGVDAIRVRMPLGFMGEIDGGYVFGDDFEFEKSALFLRTRFYLARTDFSLVAICFRENLLVGVDLARSVGGAGCWLEAAHTFADALADEDPAGSRGYFRGSIGLDYSLGSNTYAFVEYHFNEPGRDDAREYLANALQTAYVKGSVYLMGRHYLAPGITCQVTPLVAGGIDLLCNLSDWSAYLAPSFEYNLSDNIYLTGGAYVGIGKRSESMFRVSSEFGWYPDIYFSSFRIYF